MRWDDRIGRRLKLKDLHTLRIVADVGSMAKAAKLLAMSQPAISKAMAELEHTLGVPVLDRTSQGIEITSYEQALLKHGLLCSTACAKALPRSSSCAIRLREN